MQQQAQHINSIFTASILILFINTTINTIKELTPRFSTLGSHLFFLIKNITQTVGVLSLRFREGLKGRPPFPVAFFAPKLHSSKYNNHKNNKITAVNAVQ